MTTRLFNHLCGVGNGANVAVTEDGNRFNRFNGRSNALPIDVAREALLTGAAMNRDRGDADLFKLAGKVGS